MSKEKDREGRDKALALLEEARAEYLAAARKCAKQLWARLRKPISVDDVRAIHPPPDEIDPRVMGAIFHKTLWAPVGRTTVGKHAHARHIRTFVPIHEAEWFKSAARK